MATCNVETLMQDAAASGFSKLAERNKHDVLLQLLCNIASQSTVNRTYAVSSGNVTSSLTNVHSGVGVTITPVTTGHIKATFSSAYDVNSAAANSCIASLAYGLGPLPALDTAYDESGSDIAKLSTDNQSWETSGNVPQNLGFYAEVTGLTVGLEYYFSIVFRRTTAASTAERMRLRAGFQSWHGCRNWTQPFSCCVISFQTQPLQTVLMLTTQQHRRSSFPA
jgi:hypothetical protein